MKILFYVDNLESGGAARVVVNLANELVQREHIVYIATNTVTCHINYAPNDKLHILPWYSENHYQQSRVVKFMKLLKAAREIAQKTAPDFVIGVQSNAYLFALLGTLRLNIPIIASDHTSFARKLPKFINFIRFYLYNFADAVTILTQSDYDFLGSRLPKKKVISNPLSYPIFKGESMRRNNILAAGRLEAWSIKGFDLLIEVWGRIANMYPDWVLEIAGGGSEQALSHLKLKARKYNVEHRVNFLGFCSDIDIVMRESSIFVLSSRVEGFGMVLIEAMSQGCACIAFDDGGRQKEIITSDDYGLLVENGNLNKLEKALVSLIEDDDLRKRLSKKARNEVNRYSTLKVVDRWELLFKELQCQQ